MSHLHIPDGVISPVWTVVSFTVLAVLLFTAVKKINYEEDKKKIPFTGMICAFMLLAMSVPLGFLPIHLNLTVLAGIVLGPWLGIISVFVVNLLLSLVGHGGITVLGLNTLIMTAEVLLGFYLFTFLKVRWRLAAASVFATVLTLSFSLILMIGIVGMTQIDPALALHEHDHHLAVEEINHDHHVSLTRFAMIVVPLGVIGITLEAVAIALIIGYLNRIRPDLIDIDNNVPQE